MPGYVTEREDHADYLLLKKIYLLKIKSEQHKVNKVSINVQEKRKRMQSGYVKSHAKGNKNKTVRERRSSNRLSTRSGETLTPKILEAIPRSPGSN